MKLVRNLYAYTGVIAAGSTLALSGASKAFAVDITLPQPSANVSGTTDIKEAIQVIFDKVYPIIFLVLGIAAVLYLLYSGFLYITSAGDPEKAKKARAGIVSAIIGLIVVAATFWIIRFALTAGNSINAIS